jgi:hypothetical protein
MTIFKKFTGCIFDQNTPCNQLNQIYFQMYLTDRQHARENHNGILLQLNIMLQYLSVKGGQKVEILRLRKVWTEIYHTFNMLEHKQDC